MYLQTRAGLHFGAKNNNTKCPYCVNEPLHTYVHCINDCEFALSKTKREYHENEYTRMGKSLPIANIEELTNALTTKGHEHLHYYLDLIKTSPYL
jgi:hypothetical protein